MFSIKLSSNSNYSRWKIAIFYFLKIKGFKKLLGFGFLVKFFLAGLHAHILLLLVTEQTSLFGFLMAPSRFFLGSKSKQTFWDNHKKKHGKHLPER